MLGALKRRARGVRGIEWMALIVAASLLALALMGGGGRESDARTDLERRMEKVLSAIDGAGRVQVLVSERPEEAVRAFSAQDGGVDARITGVLIVAEGAGDLKVRLALASAARAILNVELSNIEVVEMRRD